MRYLVLLAGEEPTEDHDPASEAWEEDMRMHEEFAADLEARGIASDGAALELSPSATTLRPAGDGVVVTDGPFLEAREQIGGLYLLERDDLGLDEVLGLVGRFAHYGAVEVRPCLDLG